VSAAGGADEPGLAGQHDGLRALAHPDQAVPGAVRGVARAAARIFFVSTRTARKLRT
jgi:hypothetical protein